MSNTKNIVIDTHNEGKSELNPFPVIVNDPSFTVAELPLMCQTAIYGHRKSLLPFVQRLGRKKRFAYRCFLKGGNRMPSTEIISSDFCFNSEQEATEHLNRLIHDCIERFLTVGDLETWQICDELSRVLAIKGELKEQNLKDDEPDLDTGYTLNDILHYEEELLKEIRSRQCKKEK